MSQAATLLSLISTITIKKQPTRHNQSYGEIDGCSEQPRQVHRGRGVCNVLILTEFLRRTPNPRRDNLISQFNPTFICVFSVPQMRQRHSAGICVGESSCLSQACFRNLKTIRNHFLFVVLKVDMVCMLLILKLSGSKNKSG